MYVHPFPVYLGETFEVPLPTRDADGAAVTPGTWADADFSFYKDGSTTVASIQAADTTPSSDFDSDTGKSQLQIVTNDSDFTAGSRWAVWAEKTIATFAVVECVCVFRIESASEAAARSFREAFYTAHTVVTTTGNTTALICIADLVPSAALDGSFAGELLALKYNGGTYDTLPIVVRITGYTKTGQLADVEQLDGTALDEVIAAGDFFWRVGQHTATDGAVAALPSATQVTGVGDNTSALLTRIGTPTDLGGGDTIAFNLSDIESQTDDIGAAGAGLTGIPATVDWLNGGRLDLLLDAVKVKTDSLTFTGGSVQTDLQSVDGASISKGGSAPSSPYGET